MRYFEILLEYNKNYLLMNYNTTINKKLVNDTRSKVKSLDELFDYLDTNLKKDNTLQRIDPYKQKRGWQPA